MCISAKKKVQEQITFRKGKARVKIYCFPWENAFKSEDNYKIKIMIKLGNGKKRRCYKINQKKKIKRENVAKH